MNSAVAVIVPMHVPIIFVNATMNTYHCVCYSFYCNTIGVGDGTVAVCYWLRCCYCCTISYNSVHLLPTTTLTSHTLSIGPTVII